jgi:tetratricopeptide (TPR) repeat protein
VLCKLLKTENSEAAMRFLFVGILTIILSGCLGEKTFDASSETSIKKSTKAIQEALPKEKIEDFNKAMMYFFVGGENGFKTMMGAAFLGESDAVRDNFAGNLKVIDGLTGEQIIEKHKKIVAEQKAVSELENEAENFLENKKFQEALEKYEEIGKIPYGVGSSEAGIKNTKKAMQEFAVSELENEAKNFLENKKFQEALEKYEEIGKIPYGAGSSEAGIKNTKKAMQEFTEKMGYIDNVEITEFTAKRIDTYTENGIPAVRISLKNKGDRSLDMVKVIIYFQDKGGQTIFEEHFTPVLVSDYSFSDNNKPLKPGYVYEMEMDKFLRAPLTTLFYVVLSA